MSNFKDAAYETLSFWSMKSALRLLDGNLADFVGDETNTSSKLRFDFELACTTSRLMHNYVLEADGRSRSLCIQNRAQLHKRGSGGALR